MPSKKVRTTEAPEVSPRKFVKTPVRSPRPSKSPAEKPAKGKVSRRFWLTYPPRRIKTPVIWELGHRFAITTNIRQASVTDEVGIVCLEVDGAAEEVDAALRWLKKLGLSVEPVELSTVAG
jgi:hypothetical protein